MKRIRDDAYAKVTSTVPELVELEERVKTVLNTAGVATFLNPAYHGMARRLWSIRRGGCEGAALLGEAQRLGDYWVARGLDPAVVEATIGEVFGLAYVPPGP